MAFALVQSNSSESLYEVKELRRRYIQAKQIGLVLTSEDGQLDMAAVIDTVNHTILLNGLNTSFGISVAQFCPGSSLLSQGGPRMPQLGDDQSAVSSDHYGVPEGCVECGRMLFLLCKSDELNIK